MESKAKVWWYQRGGRAGPSLVLDCQSGTKGRFSCEYRGYSVTLRITGACPQDTGLYLCTYGRSWHLQFGNGTALLVGGRMVTVPGGGIPTTPMSPPCPSSPALTRCPAQHPPSPPAPAVPVHHPLCPSPSPLSPPSLLIPLHLPLPPPSPQPSASPSIPPMASSPAPSRPPRVRAHLPPHCSPLSLLQTAGATGAGCGCWRSAGPPRAPPAWSVPWVPLPAPSSSPGGGRPGVCWGWGAARGRSSAPWARPGGRGGLCEVRFNASGRPVRRSVELHEATGCSFLSPSAWGPAGVGALLLLSLCLSTCCLCRPTHMAQQPGAPMPPASREDEGELNYAQLNFAARAGPRP
ncbi:uncharacterized protein LOC142048460 [Phalacrocorax aristotelis]|uniref:uncharacterized protein LOC142048460 n=1 Tax=Phalacrocorax aristotelis TaxID=126867 RepID=UPI003F4CA6DE